MSYARKIDVEGSEELSELEASFVRIPESSFDFYTRRALEERQMAKKARSSEAAAAHLYLAAAYSSLLARSMAEAPDLEELALSIR